MLLGEPRFATRDGSSLVRKGTRTENSEAFVPAQYIVENLLEVARERKGKYHPQQPLYHRSCVPSAPNRTYAPSHASVVRCKVRLWRFRSHDVPRCRHSRLS